MLKQILEHPGIWRADQCPDSNLPSIPSGFPELDALLPGGGWPCGALTEILLSHEGIGELRLIMPALAHLSQTGRWLAWVSPPYVPYAPALASYGIDLSKMLLVHPRARSDGLWAMEQALRSGTCGAVLAWPSTDELRTQRRLQLAAEAGGTAGIFFRSERMAMRTSYAALRLRLRSTPNGISVHILKRRGGWECEPLHLTLEELAT